MTMLKMWGNSAALRIPNSVMKEADLSLNQEVTVKAEHGRLIVEPAVAYRLDDLVAAMTSENSHQFVDQPKVGAEDFEW